ncbi:hypothetical protein Cha6605_1734 [Chamaesiphon minutus PCC 6605]|uniref:Uncharacterized protein n=1 Tax=Chamaesiphon minutus (strain ATCC 27169 / PCC 6605) TaxID=1173020 RepID=K9UF80_CHAP6|nr:hypothetical protein Cha6605_1734 [Chamaesiphon minutus PCC 6605]
MLYSYQFCSGKIALVVIFQASTLASVLTTGAFLVLSLLTLSPEIYDL